VSRGELRGRKDALCARRDRRSGVVGELSAREGYVIPLAEGFSFVPLYVSSTGGGHSSPRGFTEYETALTFIHKDLFVLSLVWWPRRMNYATACWGLALRECGPGSSYCSDGRE